MILLAEQMPFQKGQSGNPAGRPPMVDGTNLRELCRTYTPQAVQALVDIAIKGEKEAARVSAASALLDRGWGRPLQQIGDGDGNAIDWMAILTERRSRT